MFHRIWQQLIHLWRRIKQVFIKSPPPPPPPTTPPPSFGECEQKFMELLEGVANGWSRGTIQGFFIGTKIKNADWENWLQEFGERLLASPELNLELARRMVRLGEANYGKISEMAGKIGRELLARENQAIEISGEAKGEEINNLDNRKLTTNTKATEGEVNQEAVELFNQGVDRYYAGDLAGAIAAFQKSLEIDRNEPVTWQNLGVALNKLGRYIEAIAALDKALEIDPNFHYAWNGKGNALRDLGRYSEAIAALDKALEITQDQFWEAWFNRGWAFFNSGRYLEAIQNWDEGLDKYLPSNPNYRQACGELHQAKGKAHYRHGKQTTTYFEYFHKAKASYEQACEYLKSPLIAEVYLEVLQDLIVVCRILRDPKTNEYHQE